MALNEEHMLRVFEKEVKKISGGKWDEVAGDWGEDYTTKSFMICTPHQIL